MHVIKQICDSVSLLEAGRIVEHGPLRQVASNPDGQLARALLPLPAAAPQGSGTVLEILFAGDSASEPVLSGLTRHFSMDVNVLAGGVEGLAGLQFGRMLIELDPAADVPAVVSYLNGRGVGAKVAAA
jgi:D-methionine transport system ATP-binding protein